MSEENKNEQLDVFLTEIGDAIREVKGTTGLINAHDMAGIVRGMSNGGVTSLQEKTITPSTSSQSVTPDSGYNGLSKVTVAAIPSSYVKPTTTKGATTYTPTTSNQTIASGTYLSGVQTIKGDTNLVASNIKSGVSIFNITGTYIGSGDGGGSGSVETCSVTLNYPSGYNLIYTKIVNNEPVLTSFYINAIDMNPATLQALGIDLSIVMKGSYLILGQGSNISISSRATISGDVELISGGTTTVQNANICGRVFKINGDCSITIE